MEWFGFGIYSYLAVTLGKVFFPEIEGTTQLVYTFATFAVAFLVRPFGGMFFDMLGDRIGRKKILAITLTMIALATLSIRLIPSYASIGDGVSHFSSLHLSDLLAFICGTSWKKPLRLNQWKKIKQKKYQSRKYFFTTKSHYWLVWSLFSFITL